MTPSLCIAISAPTLRALLDFQSEQDSENDPAELAKPAGQQGYFWKKLFLPDGTRLRISNHMTTRYAAVVGDDLICEAMTVSPNRFAQMTLGSARNAWEVIHIQMPGQRQWKMAQRLRRELESDAGLTTNRTSTPAPTPASAPQQLAQRSAPQRTLPAGVLHVPQLRPDCEERRQVYRRAEDLLLD